MFQDRDTREKLYVVCSKKNVSETKLDIKTWQSDIYIYIYANKLE